MCIIHIYIYMYFCVSEVRQGVSLQWIPSREVEFRVRVVRDASYGMGFDTETCQLRAKSVRFCWFFVLLTAFWRLQGGLLPPGHILRFAFPRQCFCRQKIG